MNWKTLLTACLIAALPLGCDSDAEGGDEGSHDTDEHDTEDGHDHDEELITTVTLTFTSESGDTVTAAFSDPDGDGGESGMSDEVVLAADTTYSLAITFANALEEPAEDVTPEIQEEAEEHQIFIHGSSVIGPASAGDGLLTHEYADLESDYTDNAVGDDLPVGLSSTIVTGAAGAGELEVMLRHLPELNGTPVKTADLAGLLLNGDALPGDVDAAVSFDVTVQ